MLISYTIPCHKRGADLAKALPYVIEAALVSPPVEVVLVDYANDPALIVMWIAHEQNALTIVRYHGRDHYHSAHARNLSVKASTGDYVVISSADICPRPNYFEVVRQRLEETHALWLRPDVQYVGVVVVQRDELIAAGGFDERIAYYGSEDKDLIARLHRRTVRVASYDASSVLDMFRTTNAEKVKHYGVAMSKTAMMQHGSAIYHANIAAGTLVANEGVEWGAL